MRLIAEVKLYGERLVPWSPPRTFLGGKPGGKRHHVHLKDQSLIDYQDAVRAAVRAAYGGEPYRGAAMLCFTFVRGTEDEARWGTPWWAARHGRGQPDITNLLKATEDALTTWRPIRGKNKGRVSLGVIEDDSQVSDSFQKKRWGPQDGLEVRVYAMETES